MSRKLIAGINIVICLFLFGLTAIASQINQNPTESPIEKIDMIGPEDLNTEVLVEINEEETPLAQALEEQKEEFGKPFSDPGYKLFYYLYGIIISLVILMTLFLWRFREDKGY
ncbi:MAG: hypothetical protein IKS54_07670 [Erysipelotrichaceae bacterium]|nr:hypothetical protein [Erysipelotrichaceae bacterium]